MRFQIVYPQDLERLQERGAVVIDLRDQKSYARGHVKGARNVPQPDAEELARRMERRYSYIIYCEHGGMSTELARDLGSAGYTVATVAGGWNRIRKYL